MTAEYNFEDLQLTRNLNTITQEYFPDSFPLHWHKYIEIISFTGTESAKNEQSPAKVAVNQKEYMVFPGDILFVWSGELHEIVDNTVRGLSGLQFSPIFFNELPDFTPFIHCFRSLHLVKSADYPEYTVALMMHISEILNNHTKKTTFRGVEDIISLYRMFIEFGTFLRDTKQRESTVLTEEGFSFTKISKVCSYITENCEQDLTLDSMAAFTGISSCYFSRIFARATSSTFTEYLTLQRIKKAQMLLAEPDLSITEISYMAGFRSISTFNRVFRQYRNCSPSCYRRYYLQNER